MEATIVFGYHIFLMDNCIDSCTYIPDLMTNMDELKRVLDSVQLCAPLSIIVSSNDVLYVGVKIPSAWNENADAGPRITFDEQLLQTQQNSLTWNDWFDTYHDLHNQKIALEKEHPIYIKCENETPCLFATLDLTTLKHLPSEDQP